MEEIIPSKILIEMLSHPDVSFNKKINLINDQINYHKKMILKLENTLKIITRKNNERENN